MEPLQISGVLVESVPKAVFDASLIRPMDVRPVRQRLHCQRLPTRMLVQVLEMLQLYECSSGLMCSEVLARLSPQSFPQPLSNMLV